MPPPLPLPKEWSELWSEEWSLDPPLGKNEIYYESLERRRINHILTCRASAANFNGKAAQNVPIEFVFT